MKKWNEMSTKVKIGTVAGIIVGIAIIIGLYAVSMNSNKDTTASSENSSSVSSSSSETSSQYKEGRDYTVEYSNKGILSKSILDKALKNSYLDFNDPEYLKMSMTDMVDTYAYYVKSENIIIFKNINPDKNLPIVGYDISKGKKIEEFEDGEQNPKYVFLYHSSVDFSSVNPDDYPLVWHFHNKLLKVDTSEKD